MCSICDNPQCDFDKAMSVFDSMGGWRIPDYDPEEK